MSDGEHYRIFPIMIDYRYQEEVVIQDADLVRVDYSVDALKLKLQADGKYPTSGDTFAFLPIVSPKAARWDFLEAHAHLPANTSIEFQVMLPDLGSERFYWNDTASEWQDGGTTNFSPEEDISAHLDELPTNSNIKFVVRLASTDGLATPTFYGLSFSYLTRIDPVEDFLYRCMIPYFRELSLWVPIQVKMPTNQDFIDLGDLDDLGYNLTDLLTAFNLTNDPNRSTDIGSSYNPSTRRVTFISSQTLGEEVEIRMYYEPESIAAVGVDYAELKRVPAFVITDMSIDKVYHFLREAVSNKGETKSRVLDFEQADWSISVLLAAGRQTDIARMIFSLKQKVNSDPFIRSVNFDERYSVFMSDQPSISTSRSLSDLREARVTLMVKAVPIPIEATEEPIVKVFKPSYIRG